MGNTESGRDESFGDGLLEYPQYTRPADFRGWLVPEPLRSGDHARVARWRRAQALRRTLDRRPDLLGPRALTAEERRLLDEFPEGPPDR
jgi:tRNA (guanine37-N1)-methyltransferase